MHGNAGLLEHPVGLGERRVHGCHEGRLEPRQHRESFGSATEQQYLVRLASVVCGDLLPRRPLGCPRWIRPERVQCCSEPITKPRGRTVTAHVDGEVDEARADLEISVMTEKCIGAGRCIGHRDEPSRHVHR